MKKKMHATKLQPQQIDVEAKELKAALAIALPACNSRSYVPILANVKLEANQANGSLLVIGTDLEIRIAAQVTAGVQPGGPTYATTVPGKAFKETLKSLDGKLRLTLGDGSVPSVTIESDKGTTTLHALPADDFPVGPAIDYNSPIESFFADNDVIRAAFASSCHASDEPARGSVLMGSYIEITKESAFVTSTDGYKLGHFEFSKVIVRDAHRVGFKGAKAIVTPQFATAMKKLPKKGKGFIGIYTVQNQGWAVYRQVGDGDFIQITNRCVDGQYPNYDMVIPKPPVSGVVRIDIPAMLAATNAASQVAGDRANLVAMEFNTERQHVTISASSDTLGKVSNAVPFNEVFTQIRGDKLQMAFNGKYFAKCLASFPEGKVDLQLYGPLSPVRMNRIGNKSDFVLLMPLHQ